MRRKDPIIGAKVSVYRGKGIERTPAITTRGAAVQQAVACRGEWARALVVLRGYFTVGHELFHGSRYPQARLRSCWSLGYGNGTDNGNVHIIARYASMSRGDFVARIRELC
jgi:hypothetical protein